MGAVSEWLNRRFARLKSTAARESGPQAERLAMRYLQQHGLQLVEQNYRCAMGEIDLIMKHEDTLVFVEVKFRSREEWANALESVTRNKQLKIIKAAQHFLQQRGLHDQVNCRFDVVAIDQKLTASRVSWIEHAFY